MEQTTYKKNAVFVSAGKTSLHRQLLKGDANFDLHLLIYDDSYSLFCHDTKFISVQSGYKMDMTYRYLQSHPEFLENYEYFFLMDDDIEMSSEDVNRMFHMMREYDLKIAQPSLVMSYYTYKHTAHHPLCILRYTNFVEMMVPCFSKEALVKVLPTFEKKVRWGGIECHWPVLVEASQEDMAVIDAVCAVHTHPVSSWSPQSQRQMIEYLERNNLSWSVEEYAPILREGISLEEKQVFDQVREHCWKLRNWLYHGGLLQMKSTDAMVVITFLLLNFILWDDRRGLDVTAKLMTKLDSEQDERHFAELLKICSSSIDTLEKILPWETTCRR